jgi:hypothetical protein
MMKSMEQETDWNGKIKTFLDEQGYIVLVVGLIAFFLLKIIFSYPRFSDGSVYLYLASLVAKGGTPYRDFFYSSPPLILYLFAAWGKLFGFNWQSFNYIPIVLTIGETLLLYSMLRKKYGALASVVGSWLYLFSFAVLATTDFVTDIHVVAVLVLAGLYAHVSNRPFLSGLFFGLATVAKVYAFVFYIPLLLWYIWQHEWRKGGQNLLGFAVIFGLVNIGFYLFLGHLYLDQIVGSHLGHITGIPKWNIFRFFAWHDLVLVLAPLPLVVFLRRFPPVLLLLLVLGSALFYGFYSDIYYLYLKLFVVWLVWWWAWNISQVEKRWPDMALWISLALVTIALPAGMWRYTHEQAHAAVIDHLGDIEAYVSTHTKEQEAIYGDYEITPLLASETGQPIFRNYADTNIKFFETQIFDYDQRARELQEGHVQMVITKGVTDPNGQLLFGQEVVLPRSFFADYCVIGKIFPVANDYSSNAVVIWECYYPHYE